MVPSMSELCKEILSYTLIYSYVSIIGGFLNSCGDGLQYKQTGY